MTYYYYVCACVLFVYLNIHIMYLYLDEVGVEVTYQEVEGLVAWWSILKTV